MTTAQCGNKTIFVLMLPYKSQFCKMFQVMEVTNNHQHNFKVLPSPPDGYTLSIMNLQCIINVLLH